MKIKWLWSCFIFLLFFSCKKEDSLPPELSVSAPLSMSSFDVLDNILVSGSASDESSIEWVEIKLLNGNLGSASAPIVLTTNELNFEFSASLFVDDIHLSSGNYFIKVSVYDGKNTTSNFVEISLSAVPLVLKNTFIVSASSNSFNLYEVSGNSTILKESFNGVFESGTSNSYHQYLFFGSSLSGYGYDPDFSYIPWEIPVNFSFYNYFNRTIYSEEDRLHFISHGSGEVRAYDRIGNGVYALFLNAGEYPEDLLVFNQKVFLEVFKSSFERELVVYFKNSGLEICRLSIDKDIAAILPKSSQELYVLTESNGNCELFIYSILNNSFGLPRALPSGQIHDVVAINDNEIIIAHQSGLLRYTYNNNSLVPIVTQQFNKVKYDFLNNLLLASKDNELRYYSNLGNLVGVVTSAEDIADFYLYYNK